MLFCFFVEKFLIFLPPPYLYINNYYLCAIICNDMGFAHGLCKIFYVIYFMIISVNSLP